MSLGGTVESEAGPDAKNPYLRRSLPARPADPSVGFFPGGGPNAKILARDALSKSAGSSGRIGDDHRRPGHKTH